MSKSFGEAFEEHYRQVLKLARLRLRSEQAPISTVTLAHELFLDAGHRNDLSFGSEAQFFAYVSRAMRSMLVDMARERLAQKRNAELLPLTLSDGDIMDGSAGTPHQILAINEAFERLGRIDERLLKVAEMRAVLGMELPEVAAALGVSEPTVKRDWQRVKAYLRDTLEP